VDHSITQHIPEMGVCPIGADIVARMKNDIMFYLGSAYLHFFKKKKKISERIINNIRIEGCSPNAQYTMGYIEMRATRKII
jgi:hypothetical protein